jgi:FAD/FMN-containing dehydrogenase
LFSLALGGYGLFGIILDADLRVVPNEIYRVERLTVPASNYIKTLAGKTSDTNNIAMVYGRLRVTPDNFLQEGILNIFHRLPATDLLKSKLGEQKKGELQRVIFRGGVGSDYGKELRWSVEKHLSGVLSQERPERNVILCEPSGWFQDHSTNSTDVLVECFVPPEQFDPLLDELRKIIPQHRVDLLNITVRDINRDGDSFLHYADQNMISLVMLFSQTRDTSGENSMAKLTQEMIAATLRHRGRYYLPYRLHATIEQFHEAYPQAKQFFDLKRKHDPDELLQNEFYRKYGR